MCEFPVEADVFSIFVDKVLFLLPWLLLSLSLICFHGPSFTLNSPQSIIAFLALEAYTHSDSIHSGFLFPFLFSFHRLNHTNLYKKKKGKPIQATTRQER